jgi:hypothetical protein
LTTPPQAVGAWALHEVCELSHRRVCSFAFIKDFGNEVDRSVEAYYRKNIDKFSHLETLFS